MRSVGWLIPLAVTLFWLGGAQSANAALYWTNGHGVSRANLDGTLANPFITDWSRPRGACGVAVNGSHIYWTEDGYEQIGRANIDGSEPNWAFITGVSRPCGVAVDGSHIYWVNRGTNSIGRARLDGTEQDHLFVRDVGRACGIDVDSRFIYWGDPELSILGRAAITGDIGAPFLEVDSGGTCGVAVNATHVYWGAFGGEIGRANLDGSNIEPHFITGLTLSPCGVALDSEHLYWVQQSGGGGIGRASLDGVIQAPRLIGGPVECGLAVDSLIAPPPPVFEPPTNVGSCLFGSFEPNRRTGGGVLSLVAAAHAPLRVRTRGLHWQVLTEEAPAWLGGRRNWQIRLWPASKGRAARRIRADLKGRGRAPIKLRVRCGESREPSEISTPNEMTRTIILRRALPKRGDRP